MYGVVGLGNPGATYAGTRHNCGHMVVAALAARCGGQLRSHGATQTHQLSARVGVAPGQAGEQVILATCQ